MGLPVARWLWPLHGAAGQAASRTYRIGFPPASLRQSIRCSTNCAGTASEGRNLTIDRRDRNTGYQQLAAAALELVRTTSTPSLPPVPRQPVQPKQRRRASRLLPSPTTWSVKAWPAPGATGRQYDGHQPARIGPRRQTSGAADPNHFRRASNLGAGRYTDHGSSTVQPRRSRAKPGRHPSGPPRRKGRRDRTRDRHGESRGSCRAQRPRLSAAARLPPRHHPEDRRTAHRRHLQWPETAHEGGLLGYGPRLDDVMRQLGRQIVEILGGASPANHPIHQPTKLALAINLKTAKEIGLTIASSLVVRANDVIE